MSLKDTIKKILREELKVPASIRRRVKMDESDIVNYLRKFAIKTFGPNKKIEVVVNKACSNTAYEILDSTHTSIDNDTFHKLEDELTNYLKNKYGEQTKEFIQNFYNESGDDDGTEYFFRKHSEKDGNSGMGRGFSQSFDTWNDLLREYASWFPSLDWKDIKKRLDSMEDRKQLIIAKPEDEFNTISTSNYYFSLVKIKKDDD